MLVHFHSFSLQLWALTRFVHSINDVAFCDALKHEFSLRTINDQFTMFLVCLLSFHLPLDDWMYYVPAHWRRPRSPVSKWISESFFLLLHFISSVWKWRKLIMSQLTWSYYRPVRRRTRPWWRHPLIRWWSWWFYICSGSVKLFKLTVAGLAVSTFCSRDRYQRSPGVSYHAGLWRVGCGSAVSSSSPLSDLHLMLSCLHDGGPRHCDVEAGLHHDARLAEVDAVLQICRGLSQSLQVLLGLPVQVLVHVDWRQHTDRKRRVKAWWKRAWRQSDEVDCVSNRQQQESTVNIKTSTWITLS